MAFEPERNVDAERHVRDGMIEVLELTASFEAQRRYQESVAFVNVPGELVQMWHDMAPKPLDWLAAPVFSADEVSAIREYDAAVERLCGAFPGFLPSLSEVQGLDAWGELRVAAERALAVFRRRGLLSAEQP
jgi:hypothetical protein